MNRYHVLALGLGLAGLGLLAYGALTGEGSVGICLIFPFYIGHGPIPLLGLLMVVAAFFLFFMGGVADFGGDFLGHGPTAGYQPPYNGHEAYDSGRSIRGGGVVFIGPIPIVFGSDRSIAQWMLVVAVVITIILVAFYILVFLSRL